MTKANETSTLSDAGLDARARRAARGSGLTAKKSRWRRGSIDNHGEFMIVDPSNNSVVAGARFDLTAQDVIDYCAE
jgi:hypothetical protein